MLKNLLLFCARNCYFKPLKKSCYRKFCRRYKGMTSLVETDFGTKIKTIIGDTVDNEIYIKKHYEDDTSKLIVRLTKASDYFIDIGCNIGYFSCLFGVNKPTGKVFAIDPNPKVIQRAKENLELNKIQHYEIINCGVGQKASNQKFYVPQRRHSLGSFIEPQNESGQVDVLDIPIKPLPQILQDQNIDNAILKVDAEGYEWSIFSALSEEFTKRFTFIIFEFQPKNMDEEINSEEDIFNIPWFKNYQAFKILGNGELEFHSYDKKKPYSGNICLLKKGIDINDL